MSEERIFNIFLYFNNGVANEYGMRHHRVGGTDADKTAFLASRISDDHKIARRFQLRRNFTPEEWRAVLRAGDALAYFGEAFDQFNAPLSPIYCATAVVDGVPTVDQRIGPDAFRGDECGDQVKKSDCVQSRNVTSIPAWHDDQPPS